MPLYGRPRDRALIRALNKELMQKIIGVEVAIYKLAVDETASNIYGESGAKKYYAPVRLHALVRREDTIVNVTEVGEMTKAKELNIGFLRDELVEKNIVIEISDIIVWDNGYYEVDNVKESNYWWGRNPDTSIPVVEGDVADHGYAISIIAEVHRTSLGNLNLVDFRSGINSNVNATKLPRNI
jgi:hypothetical protein